MTYNTQCVNFYVIDDPSLDRVDSRRTSEQMRPEKSGALLMTGSIKDGESVLKLVDTTQTVGIH